MRAALALGVLLSLALCSPAFGRTTIAAERGRVAIKDVSGERNQLRVFYDDTSVTVRDAAARLVAGRGCARRSAARVVCELGSLRAITVALGGGEDTATAFADAGPCDCVVLRGGGGDDTLNGAAGSDKLDGGAGADELDDGDPTGSTAADTLIGGRSRDVVHSYFRRAENVWVDLRDGADRGDGEAGEGDRLVNVEIVHGGQGDDRLIGDRDENTLYGWNGTDRLSGGGGSDALLEYDAGRNKLSGGGGADRLAVTAFATGPIRCGRGHDTIVEEHIGRGSLPPYDELRGPWISGSCEAIRDETAELLRIDPVPDDPVAERSISFDRPPGRRSEPHRRFAPGFHLRLTDVSHPFTELAEGEATRAGIEIKLPPDVAGEARDGADFRAVEHSERTRRRLVWRFRLKPRSWGDRQE